MDSPLTGVNDTRRNGNTLKHSGAGGRSTGCTRLPAVTGEGGAALQDIAGNAAILNGGPHQEFGVGQGAGRVLHVARV